MKKDIKDGRTTLVPENTTERFRLLRTPISHLLETHEIKQGEELAVDVFKGVKGGGNSRGVSVYKRLGQRSYSAGFEIHED